MAKPPDSLFGPGFDPKPSPERDQNRDQGQSQGQSQHGSQKRSPSRALDQTPDPAPGDLLSRNPLADPSVPQRKAADPDRSVWVAASAGTGKTKVLTDRVLRLLLDGAAPERMLCLTFTKAAAAEMTNRVAKVLADWAIDPPDALHSKLVQLLGRRPTEEDDRAARRLFARVLDTPGGLKIRTIHGFCQSLLARFPLEANIPPSFGVLDDTESAALLSLARNRLLARAGGDPTDPVTRALDRLSRLTGEDGFQDLLATLSQERGPVRASLERHGGRAGLKAALAQALDLPPNLPEEDAQGWLLTRACADTAFQGPDLRRVLGVLQAGSASDSKRAAQMAPFLAAPAAERPALWPDYCAAFLSGRDSKAEKIASRLATKGVLSACPDAIEVLTTEGERLLRVRSQLRAALCLEATDALLVLGERFLEDYEQQKRAQGRLDYGDLIALTRKLLTQSGAASWVLYKLDGGLDHLLIDEAQDTSPDQWAVAWDLAEEFFRDYSAREDHRTLFVVGDRKQSIYSFQGADPRAFEAMRQRIAATLAQWADQDDPLPTPRGSGPKSTEPQPTEPGLSTAMRGGRAVPRQGLVEVPLQVSFRSTQAVLDAVNAVFRRDPARQGVVLAGETFEHLSFRQGEGGLVELWPTIAPAPEEKPEPWKPPVEALRLPGARARMAARVASKIKALTAGQEILESSGKPIRPGDIMVLLRVRGGFETELVKALKALDVPVAGVDRMVLGEQLAVQDLIALAQAALLPEDDLTLATVLKGPLFDLSEQRLYDLAQGREGRSLWGQLRKAAETDPEAVPVLKPMVTRLQSLITRARSVRPHDFFSHVLDGAGGRKVLLQRLGSESEDPLDELLSLALARERLGITDLPSFLAWAERD
ncbi:MAG: UvrD-helicase domain-containing protein, partial [Rhodospirillaceae bacterium]